MCIHIHTPPHVENVPRDYEYWLRNVCSLLWEKAYQSWHPVVGKAVHSILHPYCQYLTMMGSTVLFSSSGRGGKTAILTFLCQFWLRFLSTCQSYCNYVFSISEVNWSNFTVFSFKGKDPQQRPVFLICGCSKRSSSSCLALRKLVAFLWCQDTQRNAQKSGM